MTNSPGLIEFAPPIGEVTYSIQWRCGQMWNHEDERTERKPCPGCFSIATTSVAIPYRDSVPFTKVTE